MKPTCEHCGVVIESWDYLNDAIENYWIETGTHLSELLCVPCTHRLTAIALAVGA